MGRVNQAFGPEPRLNEALLGPKLWESEVTQFANTSTSTSSTYCTVKLGLDGCLLLQLLSVMRYIHHPRHVLRPFDTH
jgi:hypothetical protein